MSPRFERRPNPRMGSGGRGAAGRPSRFSGPPRDGARRDGAPRNGAPREGAPRDGSSADGGPRRGEYRPEKRADYRPDRRPDRRLEARPDARGGSRDERSFTDRFPRGERPRFERPRFEGRRFEENPSDRSSQDRNSQDRSRPDRSRPDRARPDRFSPDRGRPDRNRPEGRRFDAKPYGDRPSSGRPYGDRPSSNRPFTPRLPAGRPDLGRPGAGRPDRFQGREPFRARPLIVEADPNAAVGEAERHGTDTPPDLVWGRHSALAALESGRPIHRIWCTPEMRFSPKFLQLLREAKSSGVLVEEVTWARLGQLTGGAVHQGITLQTAAAETLDLRTLMEGCAALGEPALLMAVDGLTDPHNLGAIVRSAEALGAHGLVLPQRRSAGLTGSVAKVAAGALEHLPVARVVNLNRALDALKQEGYRVVGLAGEGSVSLEEADLEGPLVIVTGSEADGLSMLTRRNCDQLVRIPLRGATPSLNASVATALLLYEVARRGWMKGLAGSQPAPRIVRPQLPSKAAENSAENHSENHSEEGDHQETVDSPDDLEP